MSGGEEIGDGIERSYSNASQRLFRMADSLVEIGRRRTAARGIEAFVPTVVAIASDWEYNTMGVQHGRVPRRMYLLGEAAVQTANEISSAISSINKSRLRKSRIDRGPESADSAFFSLGVGYDNEEALYEGLAALREIGEACRYYA